MDKAATLLKQAIRAGHLTACFRQVLLYNIISPENGRCTLFLLWDVISLFQSAGFPLRYIPTDLHKQFFDGDYSLFGKHKLNILSAFSETNAYTIQLPDGLFPDRIRITEFEN
jgi:hypothetical protein